MDVILLLVGAWLLQGGDETGAPFRVDCVDAATGRGVPLVTLEAVDGMRWVSDSAGVVAIREPGLVGVETWFHFSSPGYELEEDRFGNRGRRLLVQSGGEARIALTRTQVAERLYRTTGRGLYRDLELCGEEPPIPDTRLRALVAGLDSVQCVRYGEGLFWVFGDTNRPSYPLGHFWSAGGTTRLPGDGGLDPDLGWALDFFVDETGFSRGLCHPKGPGAMWVDGLCVVDDNGRERMFARFTRVRSLGNVLEQGLLEWNPKTEYFERRLNREVGDPRMPHGRVVGLREPGDFLSFGNPFPSVRIRATADALLDPDTYECWSCLSEEAGDPRILRDDDGTAQWRWCRASPLGMQVMFQRHEKLGLTEPDAWVRSRDVETGRGLLIHAGNVEWNEHRGCYVMLANEQGGTHSFLGDVWYAEADTPMGPWVYSRRVAWHDRYSFYNPFQHPWFAKDKGRVLYFEGTYSRTFSATKVPAPLYDYNQLRYRLDTDDPRLALPRPVFRVRRDDGEGEFLATGAEVRDRGLESRVLGCPFFLLPEGRALEGTLTLHARGSARPLGRALSDADLSGFHGEDLISLGSFDLSAALLENTPEEARVWRNPMPDEIVRQVLLGSLAE